LQGKLAQEGEGTEGRTVITLEERRRPEARKKKAKGENRSFLREREKKVSVGIRDVVQAKSRKETASNLNAARKKRKNPFT